MDIILNGIIESHHPIKLKKLMVKNVQDAGCTGTKREPKDVHAMLDCCKRFLLETNDHQTHDWSRQIFTAWAWHNYDAFEKYFSLSLVEELLRNNWHNVGGAVWIVREGLRVLKNWLQSSYPSACFWIGELVGKFVGDNSDSRVVTDFCETLLDNPLCLLNVKGVPLQQFCSVLLLSVGKFNCSDEELEASKLVERIPSVIGKLLERIWLSDQNALGNSLLTVYTMISSCDSPNAIRCIGAVVQFVPDASMRMVFSSEAQAARLEDEEVVKVLDRMIFMLTWPRVSNIDGWIVCYLRALAFKGRYSLLTQFACSRVEQLFSEMRDRPELRPVVFPILSYLLLSHQHSHAVFHKIVHEIPSYVKELRDSDSSQSSTALTETAELLHCLMYQHSGFPDLYGPIVDAIENCQHLSMEAVRQRLFYCAWTKESTVQLASSGPSNIYNDESRSKTGLTGLINLGNSCYLNAVVQVLHMCDGFRRSVLLSGIGGPAESVLESLQRVFAFLTFTQRKAYSPSTFLSVSRPSWFAEGRQQDCSEFLRHLLNVMHDQEQAGQRKEDRKASSSLVGRTFGGHTLTTYRCLGCGTCSLRNEPFMDLQLAFPSGQSESNTGLEHDQRPGSDAVSLASLLEHFLCVEKLDGDNQYRCDANCGGLQNAERSTEIGSAPPYLVVNLLRFCFEGGRHAKKLTDVRYPLSFSLPIRTLDSIEHRSGTELVSKKTYGLVGVVVHSGISSDHGHYYSYARHAEPLPLGDTEDRRPVLRADGDEDTADYFSSNWFMFNDERVTPASFADFRDLTRKFAHDTAYVLVYREVDTSSTDESTSAVDLQLPVRLREMVDRDNVLYLEELQKRANSRTQSGFPLFRRSFRDDDYDGGNSPPPSNCGGSGFGNFLQGPPSIF